MHLVTIKTSYSQLTYFIYFKFGTTTLTVKSVYDATELDGLIATGMFSFLAAKGRSLFKVVLLP